MSYHNQEDTEMEPWRGGVAQSAEQSSRPTSEPDWMSKVRETIGNGARKSLDTVKNNLFASAVTVALTITAAGLGLSVHKNVDHITTIDNLANGNDHLKRELRDAQQNAKDWEEAFEDMVKTCGIQEAVTTVYETQTHTASSATSNAHPVMSVRVTGGSTFATVTAYDDGQVSYTGQDQPLYTI
ncbi:uncharacterized protein I206_100058 [Kwoniella pini CBS 10737]|uniref:Uncharacterized protein n=1 Tax=Kwoniella pini CBS 10737 TaxID=1296096 RepID=A0A1B9HSE8_9TREE|nr:uncharacterized protein I206_07873 [Kwoniella pini CBS 10737]OCF46202.1 hypothetical protein I206_07873 [Kwoniella pini CBS 10737]